jgi:hypothetical protein
MPKIGKSALGRPLVRLQAIIEASELNVAGTAQSVSLGKLPTGAVVEEVFHAVPTLLADAGSISAVVMEVGTAGDPDYLIASTSVFTGGTQTRTGGAGTGDRAALGNTEVLAKFTATGANFGNGSASDLDAGLVTVTMLYRVV